MEYGFDLDKALREKKLQFLRENEEGVEEKADVESEQRMNAQIIQQLNSTVETSDRDVWWTQDLNKNKFKDEHQQAVYEYLYYQENVDSELIHNDLLDDEYDLPTFLEEYFLSVCDTDQRNKSDQFYIMNKFLSFLTLPVVLEGNQQMCNRLHETIKQYTDSEQIVQLQEKYKINNRFLLDGLFVVRTFTPRLQKQRGEEVTKFSYNLFYLFKDVRYVASKLGKNAFKKRPKTHNYFPKKKIRNMK